MTKKVAQLPAVLKGWSESELLYFPYSPRVDPSAEADATLEASISDHFDNVKQFSVTKAELAKLARFHGLRLHMSRQRGVEQGSISDSDVEATIKEQDNQIKLRPAVRKRAARLNEITDALVSRDRSGMTDAPVSLSPALPGLFIIYGGAEANKSYQLLAAYTLFNSQHPTVDSEFTICCEPHHDSVGSWREAISIIRYGYIDGESTVKPPVIFIDSLKDILYADGGNTGSGGISTDVITELSAISAQLMREGRTVVAVLNPSQPKFMNDLYETLKTNTTGVFYTGESEVKVEDGSKNFVTETLKKVKNSVRQWKKGSNGTNYYHRQGDIDLAATLGLDVGDLLKAYEDVVSALNVNTSQPGAIAKQTAASKVSESTLNKAKRVAANLRNTFNNNTP